MDADAPVLIDGESLTLEGVAAVAGGAPAALAPQVRPRLEASRAAVVRCLEGDRPVYGVNTGFGAMAEVRIPPHEIAHLQRNLVVSHACGVGPPFPTPVVRAMTLLRANTLARGHSGVRPEVVEALAALLNAGVHPVVPSQGSVGASGDLAPLAHLAAVLIGLGEAEYRGVVQPAADALLGAGLGPIVLEAKEGLALINGTQAMTAVGALALTDASRLLTAADVVGAMTLEALMGTPRAFDARVQAVRPHPGQAASAENLRRLLADSPIYESHRDCGRVQDAYSLRCMPQVHGAGRDAAEHARRVLAIEVNSATDNPLVFPEDGAEPFVGAGTPRGPQTGGGPSEEFISAGNFHGQPVAAALDALKIGLVAVASISERRTARLVDPALSGLPPFLVERSGLNSGFMIPHVVAASLVSEAKALAAPASVDSIPTSANKEDHVSMGLHAARQAAQIVDLLAQVLAIEALAAAQGLDFRRPLRAGRGAAAAHERLREAIPRLDGDRLMGADLAVAKRLVLSGALAEAAGDALGVRLW
ncbi:MAG TPA: histidine ammonia-lyase [Thermodesulfobacteriota bacterium]